MQAAGCRTVRGYKLDPVAMVDAFRECWKEQGSVPTLNQLERYLQQNNLPFRTKSYGKVFGGVGKLAQRIVDAQNGTISEAELHRPVEAKPARDCAVSLKMRHAVLKRDGYRCRRCGADPSQDGSVRLEVDHIVAVARGGKSTMDNLQALCWECNQGKKDRDD
ncbi:MAG: HNH endonuclease signature motif containing protein [Coriobacteriia bacterium]|nr:HNH endonuclease signature motif containing protein [Coriobacteriia bacterium]